MNAASRMADDSRRSRIVKDDKSSKSKKKIVTKDASPASTSGPSDISSIRRSSRKQTQENPSNTRKSERLDKMTPSSTPPLEKKSERTQKQMTTNPMMKSDRSKKHTSLDSSGSKKVVEEPASSNMKSKKEKVERSLKHCAVDTSEDSRRKKQGLDVGGRKRKRAVIHIDTDLPKPQRIRTEAGDENDKESRDKSSQANSNSNGDVVKELKKPDKLPQLDNSKNKFSGNKVVVDKDDAGEECSDRTGEESSLKAYTRQRRKSYLRRKLSSEEVEEFDFRPKFISAEDLKVSLNSRSVEGVFQDVVKEPLDDGLMNLEQVGHVDCPSRNSLDGESIESGSEEPIGVKGSSERETSIRKTDSDTCSNIKDNPISRRSPFGCKRHGHDETCLACSKKPRTNNGLGKQQELDYCETTCNTNLLDTSSSKDRRTCEAVGLTEIVEKNDAVSRMGTSICIVCKLGGKLRCCDSVGCNRYYHLSCLDPPVNNVPLGNWHCPFCVKNIKSSVPTVSGVVESIWDTREVEMSEAEGLQKQKQYFVKYKGLSHIHNQWVTETQLLLEAPLLVADFSKSNSMMKWTIEWTVPHQLLKKRLLLSFKPLYESQRNAGKVLNYHYEWLVKWQGLDCEQATWESESTSVLESPKGHNLIKEYKTHHRKAKISASPVDKTEELPVKLPTIPDGCPPGMDNIHLSYVKNLHDAWNKGQNSVVFDDQERTMRIVLFIFSLKVVTLPFLIITTSSSLSRWEDMFSRLAPCNDFKVSIEDMEGQRSAKLLEVQKEGGQLAFQVLLNPADAFLKDLNVLKAIKWEVVIVDESQSSEISTCFSHIKSLSTYKRLLVFCGPLGVGMAGYPDVLSLLGCDDALPSRVTSKTESDDISKLKESLSRFIAYECKSSSSKFVEFWVPVQISNVQLEQYCSVLLSNAMALSSCSKSDTVGALHDILVSNRKSCDHPYIVNQSLQGVLTKDLEPAKFLDVGIKASGKLQFLDQMLPEMKKRQLRVLILFQPLSGSGRDSTSIGDILDDFVRQRFGEDSYERVDGVGIIPSKKQAALNNFNNKDMGRFIFLLEYRACLPSIKLSSVDSIVIFDSDWNPTNDFKALQKITIDSRSEQIMIFRLYTSWTLEEKILRLAEQNVTIDSKLQNISRSTSDALLMWGAPYLFNKLAEFHSASVLNISSQESFWNELLEEFLNLISHKCKSKDTAKLIITRVQQSCGTYGKHLPLPNERITQLPDGEQPHTFWRKLLEGKNPHWKYLSLSIPRQRKRPQYFEQSPEKKNAGNDDVGSKRKKTANNVIEPAASKPVVEEGKTGGQYTGASGIPANDQSQLSPGGSFWCNAIHNETNFRDLLKLNISKLCKVLGLLEDVKIMVERFLEYVIENYRVNKEPANTLQAFLLSLCWMGSALLNQKLDRRQSLDLAKKHLHFSCKEEEANSVYLKLEPAKDTFLRHIENEKKIDVSKDSIPAAKATSTKSLDPRVSQSAPLNPQGVKVDVLEIPDNQYVDEERILMELAHLEIRKLLKEETLLRSKQMPSECERQKEKYVDDDRILLKLARSEICRFFKEKTFLCSKEMPCECERQKKNLAEKYKNEIEIFNRESDGRRLRLENEYKVATSFINNHNNPSVRSEKLKSLDNVFATKLEAHERQKGIHLKHLKAMQLAVEGWIAATSHSSACEYGSEHENPIVLSGASENGRQDSPKNAPDLSGILTEVKSHDKDDTQMADVTVSSVPAEEIPAKKQEGVPTDVVKQVDSADSNKEIAEAVTIIPGESLDREDEDQDATNGNVDCNQENEGGTISPDVSHALEDHNDSGLSVPTNLEIQNESIQDKSSSAEICNLQPIDAGQVDQFNSEDSSLEPQDKPSVPFSANPAVAENQYNVPPASQLVPEITHEEPTLPYSSGLSNPSDHTTLQSGPNLSNVQVSDNHNQGATRMQNQSLFFSDPLQAELEQLCELKNNIIKCHEDIKLKIKSDHEKELAEMIAELNRKYEAKHQEAETTFHLKRKQVDTCLNKVVMNKILADAFRSNCKDLKPSENAGLQQVTQSRLTQHPRQFYVQPSTRVTSSSPARPLGTQLPLQIVNQPAQLFSTTSIGPPSNLTPSTTPTRPPSPPIVNPITTPTPPTRPPPPPIVNPVTTPTPPTRPPPPTIVNPITTPTPPPIVNPITVASPSTRPPPPPIDNPITVSSPLTRSPPPSIVTTANPLTRPPLPPPPPPPPPKVNPITTSSLPTRLPPPPMVNPITASSPPTRPPPPPMANPVTASTMPIRPPSTTNPTTPSSTTIRLPSNPTSTTQTRPPPSIINPSSPPTRPPPPIINPITPAARNPRPSSEIRGPAPHIRPFRPSTSNLSSQRVLPRQHSSNNFPPPVSIQLPPIPSVPIAHTGLYTTFSRPETDTLNLPPLDLFMNVDNWAAPNSPPEFGKDSGTQPNDSLSGDVVCLSDDD